MSAFALTCFVFCGRILPKCEGLSNPALGSAPSEQERPLGVSIFAFYPYKTKRFISQSRLQKYKIFTKVKKHRATDTAHFDSINLNSNKAFAHQHSSRLILRRAGLGLFVLVR